MPHPCQALSGKGGNHRCPPSTKIVIQSAAKDLRLPLHLYLPGAPSLPSFIRQGWDSQMPRPPQNSHPERSEGPAVAVALVFAGCPILAKLYPARVGITDAPPSTK